MLGNYFHKEWIWRWKEVLVLPDIKILAKVDVLDSCYLLLAETSSFRMSSQMALFIGYSMEVFGHQELVRRQAQRKSQSEDSLATQ